MIVRSVIAMFYVHAHVAFADPNCDGDDWHGSRIQRGRHVDAIMYESAECVAGTDFKKERVTDYDGLKCIKKGHAESDEPSICYSCVAGVLHLGAFQKQPDMCKFPCHPWDDSKA